MAKKHMEKARELTIDNLCDVSPGLRNLMTDVIATALAEAERAGLERACKAIDEVGDFATVAAYEGAIRALAETDDE